MTDVQPSREYPKWDYQEYPKTLARDDFWGQVRRTIHGQRIAEADVAFLVSYLRRLLQLEPADVLLDLGCGNGALAARLFDECGAYVGVDNSAYLIDVAREYFEHSPEYRFVTSGIVEFAVAEPAPEAFTKGLCYAVAQFLPPEGVRALLLALGERFVSLGRVVVGNFPNRDQASLFFQSARSELELDCHESPVGRWWSKHEVESLASETGWKVSFSEMPSEVFNAGYRFDAILTRAVER